MILGEAIASKGENILWITCKCFYLEELSCICAEDHFNLHRNEGYPWLNVARMLVYLISASFVPKSSRHKGHFAIM